MINNIKLPPQEWLGYDPERGDIHGYTFEGMREFVEFIIRECIHACIMEQADPRDTVEIECALRIKRHFGVE